MNIRIPLFRDEKTPEFQDKEGILPLASEASSQPVSPISPTVMESPGPAMLNVSEDAPAGDMTKHPEPRVIVGGTNGNSAASNGCLNEEGPSVHMDAMAFGMGCCCLQVTFQVRHIIHYKNILPLISRAWTSQ